MEPEPTDRSARIEAHLHRVLPLAWEYRHLGVPLEDLQSALVAMHAKRRRRARRR